MRTRVAFLLTLSLLLLWLPVGCSGTLQAGIERTPTPGPADKPAQPLAAATGGAPAATLPRLGPSALIYLRGETVHRLDGRGDQPVGLLPAGAGHLALSPRYLAYVDAGQLGILDLADGVARAIPDTSERTGQDHDLRWSNDGSSLAYALAWDEPDGSRQVELHTTDGYQQRTVVTFVARPAGPASTPPAEPPPPAQPGFANLSVLGFAAHANRLAVIPVGGQERYSVLWLYDSRTGERVWTIPLPAGIYELALSPDLIYLAYSHFDAKSGAKCTIVDLQQQVELAGVALPGQTHAASLHWSADSTAVAYLLREGTGPQLDISPSVGLHVLRAGAAGSASSLPFTASPEAWIHGWTADGEALVVETLDGFSRHREVRRVDTATGEAEPIALPEDARVLGLVQTTLE